MPSPVKGSNSYKNKEIKNHQNINQKLDFKKTIRLVGVPFGWIHFYLDKIFHSYCERISNNGK